MCGVPVQLHDHSRVTPNHVDHQTTDPGIDLGHRQAGSLAQREKALLEDAQGVRKLGEMSGDGPPQGSASGVAALEHRLEPGDVAQAPVIGLGQDTTQGVKGERGCHIEQRPLDPGYGQPAMDHHPRVLAAMHSDPGKGATAADGGHVDRGGRRLQEPPPPGGRRVAQRRARSCVEQRREQPANGAQRLVSNRVNARMDSVQSTGGEPS